mgnify:CR=1 FL=1
MSPFVKSKQVLGLVSLRNIYQCRPSILMDIADPYTAYCLDEAIGFIIGKIESGEEPVFKAKYKSMSDLYRSITG